MFTVLLFVFFVLAWLTLIHVGVEVAKTTYRHYSKGNEFHPEPFPIHHALLVAVIEVCYDKPIAFHHARMEVVRRAEERRAEAREDTKLRHPANFRARQQCQSNHPSLTGRRAVAALGGHIA